MTPIELRCGVFQVRRRDPWKVAFDCTVVACCVFVGYLWGDLLRLWP